jgi:hypothetical protein
MSEFTTVSVVVRGESVTPQSGKVRWRRVEPLSGAHAGSSEIEATAFASNPTVFQRLDSLAHGEVVSVRGSFVLNTFNGRNTWRLVVESFIEGVASDTETVNATRTESTGVNTNVGFLAGAIPSHLAKGKVTKATALTWARGQVPSAPELVAQIEAFADSAEIIHIGHGQFEEADPDTVYVV